MKTERLEFSGSGAALPGYLWLPETPAKALLLVLHGMTEHAGRYDAFAEAMTAHGFAVAAYDLRGHGRHGGGTCAAMAPGDWEGSIADIDRVLEQLRLRFGAIPVYLMGFSLGSFLVREYLERQEVRADGAILMGTGAQPDWILKIMQAVVRTQIRKAGFLQTTPLVRALSFGAYNQKFKPNRTASDWLCTDEAQLDGYLSDALCRPDIAAGTFWELLGSMARTNHVSRRAERNAFFPILLLSGDADPVGDFGKGVAAVEKMLLRAGYPVQKRMFSGARHMLLREESGGQAAQARETIVQWMNAHI